MLKLPSLEEDQKDITEEVAESRLKTLRLQRRVYLCALIILLGVIIYFLGSVLNILSVPVGILLWTTVIVFILKGPVNALERKGVPRVWGTLIAFILMAAVFCLLAWMVFSPVVGFSEQVTALIENVPVYFNQVQASFNDFYSQYSYLLQDDQIKKWVNDALATAGSMASSFAQASAQNVVTFGSGLASSLMVIGFSLVVAYWVLMELPAMGREIKRLAPEKLHEDLNVLYLIGTRVMGGYIRGTLIQCVLIGFLAGLGFTFMGIPSAAVLGVITGILNIIPVVGPWLGGALAAIVGVFVSPIIALVALVYTIVVQQLIYTFVSPKVLGDACDVHPALVILALVAGSAVGGAMSGLMGSFVGALLSIPLVAAGKSIFVYYFEARTGRTIVAPDGVIFKGETYGEATSPLVDATGEFAPVAAAGEDSPSSTA
jgi:predicted PurR-regulated permease PerM